MSLPTFADTTDLTRQDAINQILSSIAMEELALSHIINAEGEKLQYVLGTLEGTTSPQPTIEQVLEVNQSVRDVLQAAADNQSILRNKMQTALSSAVLVGPPGPAGAPGTVEAIGLQAQIRNAPGEVTIQPGGIIIFDWVSDDQNPDISYDSATGAFTINQSGNAGYYLINWSINLAGTDGTDPATISLTAGGMSYSAVSTRYQELQLSNSAVIPVNGAPLIIGLVNLGTGAITLEEESLVPANITIMGFRAITE